MSNDAIDLAVWRARWQGMHETMDFWLKSANKAQRLFDRQETLTCLLASLQAFAKGQIDFFAEGLAEASKYRLEPSPLYPWEYVFRTTVDQIGYDLDVLMRAAQQRMPTLMPPALLNTLDLADRLAYRALKPAFDHGLIDHETTVITYFQKSVNVRLVPYAPVALIGIPLTAVDNPRDLLAIPHEVGHYVFREGRIRSGRFADSRFSTALYSRFAYQPAWFNAWLEEIFADLYGCLVAGPVIALSFIELITDDPVDEFVEQDDEHPAAAVRPHSYFSALRRMGGCDVALAKIEKHWQALFDDRGSPTELHLPGEEKVVPLSQVVADMDEKVVETLLQEQFLGALLPAGDGAAHPLWSTELQQDDPLQKLYASFAGFAGAVTPDSTPIPGLHCRANGQMQIVMPNDGADGGSVAGLQQKLGSTDLLIDSIRKSASLAAERNDPAFAVHPNIWTVILDAGDWATEGPGGTITH
jgi:hypothetical protein